MPLKRNPFSLDESMVDDIIHVSDIENDLLSQSFTENETRDAIFMMENNKAPDPDGFSAGFYQYFWEIIKGGMTELFNEFHIGNLPLHSLNFGFITLLPKKAEAIKFQ